MKALGSLANGLEDVAHIGTEAAATRRDFAVVTSIMAGTAKGSFWDADSTINRPYIPPWIPKHRLSLSKKIV